MPTITSIKQQKNKSRVNIYLDNKFGIGLDLENFVKLGLKVNQELTRERIEEIKGKADFQKVSDKLLNFSLVRPRSEKEISDWLKRKKIDPKFNEDLFSKLKHFELIDDLKFAKWWIDQRNSFRPKSKRVLRQELQIKGINKNVIDDALNEASIDEEKIARELLKKNMYKWEKMDKAKAREKIFGYLGRKGFTWEQIKRTIDEIWEKG